MTDIAAIGRQHLADQLNGSMKHCDVSEWTDANGDPVKIYWKPLTGKQQHQIDQASGEVNKTCMLVKLRALDENARPVFEGESLVSMTVDYDYSVIRALAFLMASDIGQDIESDQVAAEKE